ncbi:MAG: DUF5668 domain-containing protein [Ignavibacteriae bacterium]|nr:DUF5668 domain-containing protein [Ignavibacteriota bacterium]
MKESKISIAGILLIGLGLMLLLDRLGVIYFGWDRIFWMFVGIAGAILAVDGFTHKGRGKIFWGTLMFFVSVSFSLYVWNLLWWPEYYWPGSLSLSLGLAFFALLTLEPRNVGVMVPGILFSGFGAIMLLVEFYYLDWWDVRRFLRDYWPVALIAWGIAMLLKRRPQATG